MSSTFATRSGSMNSLDGQVARLALVADAGYGSFGLALRCVLELIARGVLDAGADAGYRALAAARLPG